jgi:hypothetical protein
VGQPSSDLLGPVDQGRGPRLLWQSMAFYLVWSGNFHNVTPASNQKHTFYNMWGSTPSVFPTRVAYHSGLSLATGQLLRGDSSPGNPSGLPLNCLDQVAGCMGQGVQRLSSKWEALSSIPSTTHTKKIILNCLAH